MNRKLACKYLDIEYTSDKIDKDIIKRQYRIKALTYHPDKNRDVDASHKFQEVNESYEYLMKYDGYVSTNDESFMDENHNLNNYKNIFVKFLQKILEKENSTLYSIIQRITTICEDKAIEYLENLDKDTLIRTKIILTNYKDAFHITTTLIAKIEDIIINKNEKDECIILNPSLHDLYENNLYNLTLNDESYIIPLWHHLLVYDASGNDLYVNCIPTLPSNMEIDDKNNIHIHVEYNIKDIWNMDTIYIDCDKLSIPVTVNTLKIEKTQIIIIANSGISKINTKDIYNIKKKTDIYIHFNICI